MLNIPKRISVSAYSLIASACKLSAFEYENKESRESNNHTKRLNWSSLKRHLTEIPTRANNLTLLCRNKQNTVQHKYIISFSSKFGWNSEILITIYYNRAKLQTYNAVVLKEHWFEITKSFCKEELLQLNFCWPSKSVILLILFL